MNKYLQFVRKILSRMGDWMPCALPKTQSGFERFAVKLSRDYGLPQHPAMVQMLANAVMQLPAGHCYKAPRYFAKHMQKFLANDAAYQAAKSVQENLKRAEKLKAVEATTAPTQSGEATPIQGTPPLAEAKAQ